MITKSIKVPGWKERVLDSVDRWKNQHSSWPYQGQQQARFVSRPPVMAPQITWGKMRYDNHLTAAKLRFNKYVTMATVPPQQGRLPGVVYEIVGWNELWYSCEFDNQINEPKIMTCLQVIMAGQHRPWSVAQIRMRPLTEEELKYVDVQHSPPSTTAP